MIVGAVTMIVGYRIGLGRALVLHALSRQMIEEAETRLVMAKETLKEAQRELEKQGSER